MIQFLEKKEGQGKRKIAKIFQKIHLHILIANLICAYGMLIFFIIQGYGMFSIFFLQSSIIVACVFAYYLLKI
jgi:hypothetical protein